MFRKTTISIMIAAIAVIVLSAQSPASAEAPGSYEAECPPGTFCSIDFISHGFHDAAYPHLAEVEVTGNVSAEAPALITVTLPDDVFVDLLGPSIGLPDLQPALPPLTPEEPPAHTDPAPVPAPVDPPHVDRTNTPESTSSEQPVEEGPVVEPTTTTTSPTTTTTSPTIQDDDVDEVVAAAADLPTNEGSNKAFDPAIVALFGAIGALGLFTVGTAAYVIGRRGA